MTYLLPQLLDRAAERDSGRDGYRVPKRGLSYGELFARANRLAHALRADGVRRGDRVGIFMPRDLESAVAVYGILRAGAAFVPIDPHAPAAALAQIIEDCGLRHLISHRQQLKTLRALASKGETGLHGVHGLHGLQSVFGLEAPPERPIDGLSFYPWQSLEAFPADRAPDVFMMEDDLAYLMYSSGSTGRPKGIMHTHRSGLAYARLSAETYDVQPSDRIGNHSPLHFDMSTFGYFTSPYAGATTVLIPEAHTKLAASLSKLIEDERLTIWYSVPLALIQLLTRGAIEKRDLSSLRWVLFGGEPFSRQHLHALMRQWPNARFSNVYGPAEVNQCTYYHVPPPAEDADDAAPVPIGREWANTEGLVLDSDDQLTPIGEAGELVVRSPTMMAGYWARPDLDVSAFYRQLVGGGFERIFYRTGDLVVRHENGEMVFLGRQDRQVKVRGYRLELDEIERTAMAHDAVEEAGVVPVASGSDASGSREIQGLYAAFTVKPDAGPVDAAELRAFLAERISHYAVPQKIERVDAFPRTSSGKIDRRRLRELAEAMG